MDKFTETNSYFTRCLTGQLSIEPQVTKIYQEINELQAFKSGVEQKVVSCEPTH